MIPVDLTLQELILAAHVGIRREVSARAVGRQNAHGFNGDTADGWSMHVEGAAAECALAKHLGGYWPMTVGRLDLEGDVGEGIHVRSSRRRDACLILHPDDADEGVFWLVVGQAPHFVVVGSAVGVEGKIERFWREDTGRPAFFVPQAELLPAGPPIGKDV